MPAPKILSEGQWNIMLDYMEANPIFAKGNIDNMSRHEAKEDNNIRWKRLANRLNSVGSGCVKNYIKWREYWNNAKYKVRKKAVLIRKQINGTIIGETLLSRNEKRVLACLGIAIPVHVRMKIKPPPVSPILDGPQSPLEDGELQKSDKDMTPAATPTPEETPPHPPLQIKSEPDPHPPCVASPHYWVPIERKVPDHQAAPPAFPSPAPPAPHVPLAPEWVRDIEERRIAVEEKSARALQGIYANTEFCVTALQGIQFAQERLNKTMQGIQAALEISARALLERHN